MSVWYGTTHDKYVGFVSYIDGLGSPNTYKYFNDFSWYAWYDVDHFAVRMEAIFRAPETGTFTFKVTADDFAVLYIHDCLTCSGRKYVARAKEPSCFDCLD